MSYLFIGGCARSGTTALWRILSKSQSAVIGMERYVQLATRPDEFSPDLFKEDRFFDVRPGETWYSDISDLPYYGDAQKRFRDAKIVGDKIPMLCRLLPKIASDFPDVKIVYIVRNLFDVANSYQVRAQQENDPTWGLSRDYRRACIDWNTSLEGLDDWANQLPMAVIDYESFFGGLTKIEVLAVFLGLDPNVMRQTYEAELARSRPMKSHSSLSSMQRQYVAEHGNFSTYASALKLTRRWRYPGYRPFQTKIQPIKKYSTDDARVIDYRYVEFSGYPIRGPVPTGPLKRVIAGLGAASTFGRLVERPFIDTVASRLGLEALNLGHGGARAPFYYLNRNLMRKLNQCACAVVEVFSARGTGTAYAESRVHTSTFLRQRGTEDSFVFADAFYRAQCRKLKPHELRAVFKDIQSNYMAEMNELLNQIRIPKVLVWFSQRSPDIKFSADPQEFLGQYPHFVDRKMFSQLKLKCDASIELVSTSGLPANLLDRKTGEPVPVFESQETPTQNVYYPSQEMHDELAAALIPTVVSMLRPKS